VNPVKISFIVGAFNNPNSLRTCLSSLADQSEKAIEIIVADNSDGSTWTELNRDLCAMDDRIRYEFTGDRTDISNLGLRHTRCLYTATEIGAEMATGEFLCFPNADSYYPPVFAEQMLKAAAVFGCDLVYSWFVHGYSYANCRYSVVESSPSVGKIDKTNFILRRSCFHGYPDKRTNYEAADGLLIEGLVKNGISRKCVPGVLCFHN
jgi:glycosyltransferase involved in cell wall biosynthesis